ncbi:MAG: c-type cytochrome [Pseudomonadota bacterium]
MSRAILIAATLAALALPTAGAMAQEGDAKAGEKVFNRCKTCHMVGEKARNKIGPMLNNLIGRQAGTVEKYRYSKINKAAGKAGLKWTPENITAYLPDPNKFLKAYLKENGGKAPGRTKMAFRLKKSKDIANVIAYLKTFSKDAAAGDAKPKDAAKPKS